MACPIQTDNLGIFNEQIQERLHTLNEINNVALEIALYYDKTIVCNKE